MATFDPYPEYVTVEQAATYLGVSPASVRRLLRLFGMGELIRASIGKEVLISKEHLAALHTAHQVPEVTQRSARRRGAA
jgi:excisionase family DNA binding protein